MAESTSLALFAAASSMEFARDLRLGLRGSSRRSAAGMFNRAGKVLLVHFVGLKGNVSVNGVEDLLVIVRFGRVGRKNSAIVTDIVLHVLVVFQEFQQHLCKLPFTHRIQQLIDHGVPIALAGLQLVVA